MKLLIFFFLFSSIALGQINYDTFDYYELKGPVKLCDEVHKPAKGKKGKVKINKKEDPKLGYPPNSILHFDEHHQLTDKIIYDDTTQISHDHLVYANGKLLSRHCDYAFRRNGNRTDSLIYDDDDRLIQKISNSPYFGLGMVKKNWIYNNKGQLIEYNEPTDADGYEHRNHYEYNEKGQVIYSKSNYYGTAVAERKYVYNEQGLLTETFVKTNGKWWKSRQFVYEETELAVAPDMRGAIEKKNFEYSIFDDIDLIIDAIDLKEMITYDSTGNAVRIEQFKKDSLGRIIEKQVFDNWFREMDKPYEVVNYFYNESGLMSGQFVASTYRSEITFEREETYEYDEKGNWIRKIYFAGGKANRLVTRNIEYYSDLVE
jgi:hypothetical protein